MKRRPIPVFVSATLAGLSPMPAWAAAVDTEPNNSLYNGADTWTWQTDNQNTGTVSSFFDPVDFFLLNGFTPGTQVRLTFTHLNIGLADGPIQLEAFEATQVEPDAVTLTSTLASLTINTSGGVSVNTTVTIPANGALGLKVSDLVDSSGNISNSTEGYRITVQVIEPTSVPFAAWPIIPLLGAAAVAELRRRQKRVEKRKAA